MTHRSDLNPVSDASVRSDRSGDDDAWSVRRRRRHIRWSPTNTSRCVFVLISAETRRSLSHESTVRCVVRGSRHWARTLSRVLPSDRHTSGGGWMSHGASPEGREGGGHYAPITDTCHTGIVSARRARAAADGAGRRRLANIREGSSSSRRSALPRPAPRGCRS